MRHYQDSGKDVVTGVVSTPGRNPRPFLCGETIGVYIGRAGVPSVVDCPSCRSELAARAKCGPCEQCTAAPDAPCLYTAAPPPGGCLRAPAAELPAGRWQDHMEDHEIRRKGFHGTLYLDAQGAAHFDTVTPAGMSFDDCLRAVVAFRNLLQKQIDERGGCPFSRGQ